MTISKKGVGDGCNSVGVAVGAMNGVVAGSVVSRDGCGAVKVGEGSTVEGLRGAHAVQRTMMQRKTIDFMFVLILSVPQSITQIG